MITGAIPYTNYSERVLLVQQLKQEFENKVTIDYNDSDGLVYYAHFNDKRNR
jgi:hypothetical protein